MQLVNIRVTGLVQGVFFRVSTQNKAIELGISGWVRNCNDGSVEALFQGSVDQINAMLEWCSRGPELARVDHVQIITKKDCTNPQEGFTILHE